MENEKEDIEKGIPHGFYFVVSARGPGVKLLLTKQAIINLQVKKLGHEIGFLGHKTLTLQSP
jgi:hypothetical protein